MHKTDWPYPCHFYAKYALWTAVKAFGYTSIRETEKSVKCILSHRQILLIKIVEHLWWTVKIIYLLVLVFTLPVFQPLKSNKKVGSSEDEIEGEFCNFLLLVQSLHPTETKRW